MRDPLSSIALTFAVLVVSACGPDRFEPEEPPEPPSTVVDLDDVGGDLCFQDLMVAINLNGTTYCIDRFEASVTGAVLGNAIQGDDDTDLTVDGSTSAVATVGLQEDPQIEISWYQAKSACENAGKRLCTVEEWERACRGPELLVYPYGDAINDEACNGFFQSSGGGVLLTGSLDACGSADGVFDMSGNVAEWTDTPVARTPGSNVLNDRAVRGGSFRSNLSALRCLGDEFRAGPGTQADDIGFRCCAEPG